MNEKSAKFSIHCPMKKLNEVIIKFHNFFLRMRIAVFFRFQDAGTYKNERVIIGRQGMEIDVQKSDKKLLNFCANNYLGKRYASLYVREKKKQKHTQLQVFT